MNNISVFELFSSELSVDVLLILNSTFNLIKYLGYGMCVKFEQKNHLILNS